MTFYPDFPRVLRPWRRTLTNGDDVRWLHVAAGNREICVLSTVLSSVAVGYTFWWWMWSWSVSAWSLRVFTRMLGALFGRRTFLFFILPILTTSLVRFYLTLSFPRVTNFKLPLQPNQKYNITHGELGFSKLTQMKDYYTTNSHNLTYTSLVKRVGRIYFLNLGVVACFSLWEVGRMHLLNLEVQGLTRAHFVSGSRAPQVAWRTRSPCRAWCTWRSWRSRANSRDSAPRSTLS